MNQTQCPRYKHWECSRCTLRIPSFCADDDYDVDDAQCSLKAADGTFRRVLSWNGGYKRVVLTEGESRGGEVVVTFVIESLGLRRV